MAARLEDDITVTDKAGQPLIPLNFPADQVEELLAHWNVRDWDGVAELLDRINAKTPTLLGSHLRGIVATFRAEYPLARKIFSVPLERLSDVTKVNEFEAASAQWLGNTCLLLRKWEDAGLAWAISLGNHTLRDGQYSEREDQALKGLGLLHSGAYNGKKAYLSSLAQALGEGLQTALSILPDIPNSQKARLIAAVLPHITLHPDTSIASWDARNADLRLSKHVLLEPWSNNESQLLRYDPFLLLDHRKFEYISDFGLPISEKLLAYRFGTKVHFPTVNLTALHTTERPLSWLIAVLEHGLAARGFVCAQYWDRLRVIRVREFGKMDYVCSFVIVFHRWPVGTKFGIQIPMHLPRTSWDLVHAPATHLYPKICGDVKDILKEAEELEDELGPLREQQALQSSSRAPSVTSSRRSLFGSAKGLRTRLSSTFSRTHSVDSVPVSTTSTADTMMTPTQETFMGKAVSHMHQLTGRRRSDDKGMSPPSPVRGMSNAPVLDDSPPSPVNDGEHVPSLSSSSTVAPSASASPQMVSTPTLMTPPLVGLDKPMSMDGVCCAACGSHEKIVVPPHGPSVIQQKMLPPIPVEMDAGDVDIIPTEKELPRRPKNLRISLHELETVPESDFIPGGW